MIIAKLTRGHFITVSYGGWEFAVNGQGRVIACRGIAYSCAKEIAAKQNIALIKSDKLFISQPIVESMGWDTALNSPDEEWRYARFTQVAPDVIRVITEELEHTYEPIDHARKKWLELRAKGWLTDQEHMERFPDRYENFSQKVLYSDLFRPVH